MNPWARQFPYIYRPNESLLDKVRRLTAENEARKARASTPAANDNAAPGDPDENGFWWTRD